MATEAAVRTFFSSPNFAVVGASSNPAKFGHKIFNWYTQRSLPVTPINPGATSITAPRPGGTVGPRSSNQDLETYPTLPNLSALPSPRDTAVSVITPPAVTKTVLAEAKALGIPAVWLQPGTFDDDLLRDALADFKGGVGGPGGAGGEGYCVLVDGDRGLKMAGRTEGRL
ncbi:MAG: hypothetical protein M1818_000941 [Claussenomyces sp. TS43310]|nr:MAG: hypothetical protein M1818_000941 [Claussenomyces sp. TS43310]